MKCKMEGCKGEILITEPTTLRKCFESWNLSFACNTCGRLYGYNGQLIFNEQGHATFLENGAIVNKNEKGVEVGRLNF